MRILIVGGGVVGRTLALALAQRGTRVTLLDRQAALPAASWGNAGHIATEQVEPIASPATLRSVPRRLFWRGGPLSLPPAQAHVWLPFALRLALASRPARFRHGRAALAGLLAAALPAWQRLAQALGDPALVRADGHLVAWESAASAARGRAAWEAADTGTARVDAVDAATLARARALAPAIADAIRFIGSAQVSDLDRLAAALDAALAAAGVTRATGAATLARDGERMRVPGHDVDLIVVAAGIGSRALLAAAGERAPLIAERGYHIRAAAPDWPADLPPLVFEDRSIIATRYADRVQLAGFVEFARADAAPDPRKWQRLEAHAAALGLPLRPPFERWVGARPTLPDYLPAIGRSTRAANMFYAFGHQHLGLTLAPVTAELLADAITGAAPAIDLSPFDLRRFGTFA
ncbi:FAD-binding oxidoreductase [Sphingomonas sp. BK235]|uniref:NAD(P)/FAD-dependent oxidoreductase n=1 Tax=Sphingomonas sp. BK235 TaxID=2512131 RepID=UPI00104CC316|nr:FAD-binding oxidoreductase [Sphingomonas sp. BK235]TCP30744.1 D-amino-acid dehydrogenase [Sphingomonas sp. BK235]